MNKACQKALIKNSVELVYTMVTCFKEIDNYQFNVGISYKHPVFKNINEIIGHCAELGDRDIDSGELVSLLGI